MSEFKHKTAKNLFYDICKELGREPSLKEFMETTNLQKSSYYRVRKEYRENQYWTKEFEKMLEEESIEKMLEEEFGKSY